MQIHHNYHYYLLLFSSALNQYYLNFATAYLLILFILIQIWHVDDCVRKKGLQHRYFTVLIQLNMIDDNCGGTEVWSKDQNRGDLVRT